MGINYDPRRLIYNVVAAWPGSGETILRDNDVTNASVGVLWEGGPETLKHLFFTVGYDVVITIGDPRSRSERPVQDRPVHYQMQYPVTVTTTNKTGLATEICSGPRMQYKVTYVLRLVIEDAAQSAGVVPARTIRIVTDEAKHKRVGGIDIWEANHYVEYETGYGWY